MITPHGGDFSLRLGRLSRRRRHVDRRERLRNGLVALGRSSLYVIAGAGVGVSSARAGFGDGSSAFAAASRAARWATSSSPKCSESQSPSLSALAPSFACRGPVDELAQHLAGGRVAIVALGRERAFHDRVELRFVGKPARGQVRNLRRARLLEQVAAFAL